MPSLHPSLGKQRRDNRSFTSFVHDCSSCTPCEMYDDDTNALQSRSTPFCSSIEALSLTN